MDLALRQISCPNFGRAGFLAADFGTVGSLFTLSGSGDFHGHPMTWEVEFRPYFAFRFSGETLTQELISESYDTLCIVSNSHWLNELKSRGKRLSGLFDLRHYLIYMSNVGGFEIIAENHQLLGLQSAAS